MLEAHGYPFDGYDNMLLQENEMLPSMAMHKCARLSNPTGPGLAAKRKSGLGSHLVQAPVSKCMYSCAAEMLGPGADARYFHGGGLCPLPSIPDEVVVSKREQVLACKAANPELHAN